LPAQLEGELLSAITGPKGVLDFVPSSGIVVIGDCVVDLRVSIIINCIIDILSAITAIRWSRSINGSGVKMTVSKKRISRKRDRANETITIRTDQCRQPRRGLGQ